MSDAEFANYYIERIITEVGELTKLKLMNETRILYLEKMVVELEGKIGQQLNQIKRLQGKKNKSEEVEEDTGNF